MGFGEGQRIWNFGLYAVLQVGMSPQYISVLKSAAVWMGKGS